MPNVSNKSGTLSNLGSDGHPMNAQHGTAAGAMDQTEELKR